MVGVGNLVHNISNYYIRFEPISSQPFIAKTTNFCVLRKNNQKPRSGKFKHIFQIFSQKKFVVPKASLNNFSFNTFFFPPPYIYINWSVGQVDENDRRRFLDVVQKFFFFGRGTLIGKMTKLSIKVKNFNYRKKRL